LNIALRQTASRGKAPSTLRSAGALHMGAFGNLGFGREAVTALEVTQS
jgi:hypothetical protein